MNYLYVCTQGAKVGYTDHRIMVKKDGEILREIPVEPVECIELYGNVQMTTQVMQQCMKRNIRVGFYSSAGFFIGTLNAASSVPRSELLKAQVFRSRDYGFRLAFAKLVIRAKIHNQKVLLRRHLNRRDFAQKDSLRQIDIMERKIADSGNVNELMGYEGNAARIYFEALGSLLPENFRFSKRSRRPALDPFNAILNFTYAVLQNQVEGKISIRGLHPCIGMVHSTRGNKKALSYDLMEEWRPIMGDSIVMWAVSSHRIREEHFSIENGEIGITGEGMKQLRKMIEERYESRFTYLNRDMEMDFRQAIRYQTDRFADAVLNNDLTKYVPCRIR